MFAETQNTATIGWLPAVTAVVSFITASILDSLKDSRTHKREQESRVAAALETRRQRRNEFQRQTLLDLQRAVHRAMQSTAKMHHLDIVSFRSGSGWHKELYPADVNDKAQDAWTETTVLRVRVLDQAVRDLCQQISQQQTRVFSSANEAEGDRCFSAASTTFEKLNERIGEVLRSLDNIN